jgi:hypothetical protein
LFREVQAFEAEIGYALSSKEHGPDVSSGTPALPGQLSQELATPKFFEQASKLVREVHVAEMLVCGPDPKRTIAKNDSVVYTSCS